jgi:hypothetical protein
MPYDLIFYGAMAIIFIGIIVRSAKARRERRREASSDGPMTAGESNARSGLRASHGRDGNSDSGGGGDGGGGGGGD